MGLSDSPRRVISMKGTSIRAAVYESTPLEAAEMILWKFSLIDGIASRIEDTL